MTVSGVSSFIMSILSKIPFVGRKPPVVGVVRLSGVIGQVGALRRGLSLNALASTFNRVFRLRGLSAVALVVNSPGGSPVQSAMICRRIRELAREKDIPVIAFAEDVAASGGYWLSLAADEIYADENSIIGSIGVISASFGFTDMMEKIGVERRVHTAGERKSMLDPFREENPEDVERLKSLQKEMHGNFQQAVKTRRGGRLKADEDVLFSGEFWSGRRAQELGLIDGIGDLRAVMKDRFGDDVRFKVVGPKKPWWSIKGGGLPGGEINAPSVWADDLIAAVEERFFWGRFGL